VRPLKPEAITEALQWLDDDHAAWDELHAFVTEPWSAAGDAKIVSRTSKLNAQAKVPAPEVEIGDIDVDAFVQRVARRREESAVALEALRAELREDGRTSRQAILQTSRASGNRWNHIFG
jgi:hypothetical protein